MRALYVSAALVAAMSLAAASAEAASKKRKPASAPPVAAASQSQDVFFHDGYLLGRDPDPFIRLMILKEGRVSDQSGI
jgi:hypothetical protein